MKVLKYTLGVLLVLVIAALMWGVLIEPHLVEERHERAVVPGLPAQWAGKQVGLIADLQVGMWLDNVDTIREVVARLVAQEPALVLLAGDFVYHPTDEESVEEVREEVEREETREALDAVEQAIGLVAPIADAGIPVFAVLGNHDYGMETRTAVKRSWLAQRVAQTLEQGGIRVLRNEAVPLPPPGADAAANAEPNGSLYLVGIGSHYADNDAPVDALAEVPPGAPRIVLMHNPDSFAAIPAGQAPFAVAGHTHGGQIRLPGTDTWTWMNLLADDEIHADGWIEPEYGQPGNRLYVNRGIGFSAVPIRINARPEITWFGLEPP